MEQKPFDPDGVGVDNGTYFGLPFEPETAVSEQEGELRAAVTMEAVVLRDETAEIVKDITPEEEAAPSPRAGAVI